MSVELLILIVGTAAYVTGRIHQWIRDARNAMGSGNQQKGQR